MHTFRTTSLFEQMVRIGTPINKPTPRSIVTSFASSFFLASVPSLLLYLPLVLSVSPAAISLPFSLLFRPPSFLFPLLPPVVLPRPRKANKLSNSSGILRDSGLPLGTSNKSRVLIFRESSLRLSRRSYFHKLPARGYVHAH